MANYKYEVITDNEVSVDFDTIEEAHREAKKAGIKWPKDWPTVGENRRFFLGSVGDDMWVMDSTSPEETS